MNTIALSLTLTPVLIGGYAYAGYPLLLRALAAFRGARVQPPVPDEWPAITITLPVYNEEGRIRAKLDELLALDYPADRRHLLVISDCSSDRTDEIVREYADRGVELLRLPQRGGKSAAENAAAARLRGEIVVNTDATIRIPAHALKALVRAFGDPTVGVVSGRDVSVGAADVGGNGGESGYVGYEMGIRALETRIGSIVGASGCFYGIRTHIYDGDFPSELSRDFASALMAREHGYRAVSAEDAVCYVPRAAALQSEFRRKIRTMARGIETLWFKRHLLNPFRHGLFAWMLLSHKLARWLVYVALPVAAVGLAMLAMESVAARVVVGVALAGLALGTIGMRWPASRRVPKPLALPGFLLASNLAGLLAWVKVLRGERTALWEPTRRPV